MPDVSAQEGSMKYEVEWSRLGDEERLRCVDYIEALAGRLNESGPFVVYSLRPAREPCHMCCSIETGDCGCDEFCKCRCAKVAMRRSRRERARARQIKQLRVEA